MEIFKRSWSTRKKQLIQTMLPKLVADEKNDELNFSINPLLDKSFKNDDLANSNLDPLMTIRHNFLAGQNTELFVENADNPGKNDCHSEDKSSSSGRLAVHRNY